jgi:glycosyltransferase involved in cell wall biosynthesis
MMEYLLFHFGTLRSTFAVRGLLLGNRERLLSEFGILYPRASHLYLPGYHSHDHLVATWKPQPALSDTHLRRMREEVDAAAPHTLILSLSSVHCPDVNTLLRTAWQTIHPAAGACAAFGLRRQDKQLEEYGASLLMRCAMNFEAWAAAHDKTYPLPYGRYIERLIADFGHERLAWTLDDGTGKSIRLAQSQLLTLSGVPPEEADALCANCAPPPPFLRQPREFLAFCQAHIALTDAAAHYADFPWAQEALRIASHNPWPKPFPSLLGPRRRAAVLGAYASANAEAAQLLGLEQLFPDPEPEPDWEPFTGLTEESAFKVAERLDRDFAQTRMAEFDAIPVHYLNREQRLCRAALHDALDPPSAAPLIRKSPEPKLSVLTLTYNQAPFIAACMESVLAQQTNFPIRHIIADDGSSDGTQGIVLDYASKHKHIVPVFQKKRSCGPRNVRALFGMARTEYAALCEGDDYFTDPCKLQTQIDYLDAHPDCALCFHPVRVVYEGEPDKERVYPPVEELPRGVREYYYFSELAKVNFIQTNSVMYRWRFREGLPEWFHPELTQGDWYWHLLHAEKGKIGFLNKIMSVYRRHPQAVYILSETNRQAHRHKLGLGELHSYHVIAEHFKGMHREHFFRLADGVISDILLYARKVGDEKIVADINDKYPEFANHFRKTLEAMKSDSNKFI